MEGLEERIINQQIPWCKLLCLAHFLHGFEFREKAGARSHPVVKELELKEDSLET